MSSHSDVPSPSRPCPDCRRTYPRTVAYFHRDAGNRDGLKIRCRECVYSAERRRYAGSAETIRRRVRERYAARAAHYRQALAPCGQGPDLFPDTKDDHASNH
jgi:hypothetical protein